MTDTAINLLSSPQTEAILAHIGNVLHKPMTLMQEPQPLPGGLRRPTFRFDTDGGNFVVSISTPKAPLLQRAHDVQHFLYQQGAPVAELIGNIGVLPSGEAFQVTRFAPSKNTPLTLQDMEAFGATVARVHQCSDAYFAWQHADPDHATARRIHAERLLATARNAEETWQRKSMEAPSPIVRAIASLKTTAAQEPHKTYGMGVIHGDVQLGNTIFGEDGKVTLIDLEMAGSGAQLRDLAQGMFYASRLIKQEPGGFPLAMDELRAKAVLKGYESVKLLSPEEKHELFGFLRIMGTSAIASAPSTKHLAKLTSDQLADWDGQMQSWVDTLDMQFKNSRSH